MTFIQAMFIANYIIFAVSEKPLAIYGGFVLMVIWGAAAVMEWRETRHC